MNHMAFLNVLTTITLIAGLFFMLVGALGVLRLPDVYLRMIAASKCITVGISGMLLAAVFHFIAIGTATGAPAGEGSSAVAASTKAILVILFQFVAGPVGAYMLARSSHIDRVPMWEGTVSDDLTEDTTASTQR
jgi:multicomponent Na+:H+ antiporter subunit G